MSNMMTIIKKEFARFFGDKRLVFTTVIMPGLMIYIMYTFMGQGLMKELKTDDTHVAKAYAVNMPQEIRMMLQGLKIEWEDWSGDMADKDRILQEITDGEKDGLLYFPENFMEDVYAYDLDENPNAPNIEIYYNSEKANSLNFFNTMKSVFTAFEETMVNKYDVNAKTGLFGDYDQASENGILGKMLAGLLPMLIMTFIFSGCQSVAPESIAGEKERGTIATLLVTPVKRSALALGKIISLSMIALMAGLSSFLGTILSLPNMMGGDVDISAVSYSFMDYALLLVVIISTVLVIVAVISIISANAKSVKEATTAMAPFMLVIIVISIMPMMGVESKSIGLYFIPLFNSVQAMNGIFGFQANAGLSLLAVAVNIVAAGILTMILTKMFGSEKVMFSK